MGYRKGRLNDIKLGKLSGIFMDEHFSLNLIQFFLNLMCQFWGQSLGNVISLSIIMRLWNGKADGHIGTKVNVSSLEGCHTARYSRRSGCSTKTGHTTTTSRTSTTKRTSLVTQLGRSNAIWNDNDALGRIFGIRDIDTRLELQ